MLLGVCVRTCAHSRNRCVCGRELCAPSPPTAHWAFLCFPPGPRAGESLMWPVMGRGALRERVAHAKRRSACPTARRMSFREVGLGGVTCARDTKSNYMGGWDHRKGKRCLISHTVGESVHPEMNKSVDLRRQTIIWVCSCLFSDCTFTLNPLWSRLTALELVLFPLIMQPRQKSQLCYLRKLSVQSPL